MPKSFTKTFLFYSPFFLSPFVLLWLTSIVYEKLQPSSSFQFTQEKIRDLDEDRTLYRTQFSGHPYFNERQVIYDVEVTEKSYGPSYRQRVMIPDSIRSEDPTHEIVLIGGSFIEGQGLDDENTLPFLLQKTSKQKSRPYNVSILAKGGYAILNYYRFLESKDPIISQILHPELPKIFVYLHPNFHIRRNLLGFDAALSGSYRLDFPHYVINEENLRYTGTYRQKFSTKLWFLDLARKLYLINSLNLGFLADTLSEWDLNFVDPNHSRVKYFWFLRQAASLFERTYPNSKFLIIEYPFYEWNLEPNWEAVDLPVFKVSLTKEERTNRESYFYKYDKHPTRRLNQLIAPRILEIIESQIQQR